MVSAWSSDNSLVLAQEVVDEKSNEIKAVPKILKALVLKGNTVTIDAMGCQTEIAKQIVEKNGNYVLALKGKQGNLHDDVKYYFEAAIKTNFDKVPHSFFKTIDSDHGRIETREYYKVNYVDWLEQKSLWTGLTGVAAVISTVEIKEKVTREIRYFITRLKGNAEEVGCHIRSHWGVESKVHWVLDVTFGEDDDRKRALNSAKNFAVLRRMAINLLKNETSEKKKSNPRKMFKASVNNDYLLKILLS